VLDVTSGIEPLLTIVTIKSVDYFASTTLLAATGTLLVAVYDLYFNQHGNLVSVSFITSNTLS
jgi:hypothetical protein